jgi:hypothetical protein
MANGLLVLLQLKNLILRRDLGLNQRVQGSSPYAPIIDFTDLSSKQNWNIVDQLGGQLGNFFLVSSLEMVASASAGSRCR